MKMIKLKFAAPDKELFNGEVKQVSLTSSSGQMVIQKNHQPIIADLVISHVGITKENGENENFAVANGFFVFDQDNLYIMSTSAEAKYEIDFERAEQAKERIINQIEKAKQEQRDIHQLELALQRAINRMSLK
jgi:F-type H+-transporting ATPase subunit epsilon